MGNRDIILFGLRGFNWFSSENLGITPLYDQNEWVRAAIGGTSFINEQIESCPYDGAIEKVKVLYFI